MFATNYDYVLGVTGNELEQISYKFLYFTPYSHPPLFDMLARKGMCTNYHRVEHNKRNKHIKVCNVCNELRVTLLKITAKRSWKVSRNILLDRIPGDYVLGYQGIDSGKYVVNSY